MKKLIILTLLVWTFSSCSRETNIEENEVFIFGIYNGFCAEFCSDLYKIEGLELYADDEDQIDDFESLKFQETAMSEDKYKIAKAAYDNLPHDLFHQNETQFGCPGCVDQDIIYLSYFDGADHWECRIDTDEDALPSDLVDYAQQLKEIVQKLKE